MRKGYVNLFRFLNQIGDFRSFTFYDSIQGFFPKALEIDPPTVMHGKEPMYLKLVSTIFYEIFIFNQMIALQKL